MEVCEKSRHDDGHYDVAFELAFAFVTGLARWFMSVATRAD